MLGKLQNLTEQLGLVDLVSFTGFQRDPHSALQRADIFLLTSDYEGSPNALMEAQAMGIPAVACRCEFGPDEIIEDRGVHWTVM